MILTKVFLSFLCVIVILTCMSCKKYYWNYDCCWVSENPQIILNKGCGSGEMTIGGVHYVFYTYISNDARYIGFCNQDDEVLWEADTEFRNDCLYLTITIDNIANYEGQVIELNKSANNNL